MENRQLNIDEIKKYLPQRYPMLLVDRITEVHDDSIVGFKNVTANEPFFQGHFPDYPVMPGVLIIEAMAQTAGVYAKLKMEAENDKSGEGKQTFFASIDGVKFKHPVRPGDSLVMTAKLLEIKLGVWFFDCKAVVDDKVVCVGKLSAVFSRD